MNIIDIDQLAPAAAKTKARIRQISASTVATTLGDTETTVSLTAYFDKGAKAYRAFLMRMATWKSPETGAVSIVNGVGGVAPRVVLFSFPGEWSEERLEVLYVQAFETMSARASAGDERVGALLAAG